MKLVLLLLSIFASEALLAQSSEPSEIVDNGSTKKEDFQWKLLGQTQIEGRTYTTFANQYGDQVVYKPRTPKSKNPEEAPTGANLPNRQSIFELGVGFGISQATNKKRSEFENIFGSKQISQAWQGSITLSGGFHPPLRALKGFTIGGTSTYFPSHGFGASSEYPSKKYTVGYDTIHNIIATQDFWYIPGQESSSVFSAGAYYGFKKWQYAGPAGSDNNLFRSKDYGGVVKYRLILGDGQKANIGLYIQTLISTRKSFEATAGINIMFGRKNAPKINPQK